jgi:transcriptional regulator with XRE-family HTH domain
MEDLDALVTRLREERGMSQNALAKAIHQDRSYLSKALRGLKPCAPALARSIDDALDAGGQVIQAASRREKSREEDQVAMTPGASLTGATRRDFAVLASCVASLLDVLRASSPDLPERIAIAPRVDSETVAGLEDVVLGYRRIYQSAGAATLLDPVCGALKLLTELAPAAGPHRDQIVSLIGQAGSLAGTMLMLDQGDYPSASRYLAIAARAAQQCGDQELMAIALAARAFHSAYSGKRADGAAYAREAVTLAASAGIHPRTAGWASAVESEMQATAGDAREFERALDTAAEHVTTPMPGRPWKGIGAFSLPKLAAYRGAGLMRLHRFREAQGVLSAALAELDPVQAKHRCTAHVDLADAYARDRQPDQAARHAMEALDIIAVTRHAQSMRRIGSIYEAIRPTRAAGTSELGTRLMAVRAASVGSGS